MATGRLPITNTGSEDIYVIPSAKGYCDPLAFPVKAPDTSVWCGGPQRCLVTSGKSQPFDMGKIPPDNTLGVQIFTDASSSTPIWQGGVINNTQVNFDSDTNVMTYTDGSTVPECPPPKTQPQPPKLGGFSEEALIYWGIAFAVIIILFIAFLAFRRK